MIVYLIHIKSLIKLTDTHFLRPSPGNRSISPPDSSHLPPLQQNKGQEGGSTETFAASNPSSTQPPLIITRDAFEGMRTVAKPEGREIIEELANGIHQDQVTLYPDKVKKALLSLLTLDKTLIEADYLTILPTVHLLLDTLIENQQIDLLKSYFWKFRMH